MTKRVQKEADGPDPLGALVSSLEARQEPRPPTKASASLDLPNRKHPAHGVRTRSDQPTIISLTVCAKDRHGWMADPQVHLMLRDVWTNASAWLVGRYVILPDHVHLFAAPGLAPIPLDNWVRYWKSQFSKKISADRTRRWETDHWDSRVRDVESYRNKWEYVQNNPVRHGLVARAEDWPFQGSIHDLPW